MQFVDGSFSYSLMSPNATVLVIGPSISIVVFNASNPFCCRLPEFFVTVSMWTNHTQRTVLIGGHSTQHKFHGQHVQLNVSARCSPGSFIDIRETLLSNVTALYDFLVPLDSNAQLCSRCRSGTFSTSDTVMFCSNCTAGTFANSNNTACLPCPDGLWSSAGVQGSCLDCSSKATTRERDRCVTLTFSYPPQPTAISGIRNRIPPVVLVDVYESVIVQRSGIVSAQLQCQPPGCQTDSNAEFNLITVSLSVQDGSSAATDIFFEESSQSRVGSGFVWRLFTTQEPGTLANSNINVLQSQHQIMFLGKPVTISAVLPTQIASIGGTFIRVTSTWTIIPRIRTAFVNATSFCVFQFIDNSDVSNTSGSTGSYGVSSLSVKLNRVRAIATSDDTVKICEAPAIPELSFANLSIILEDGRPSDASVILESVCHNSFYINASKCKPCPVSSAGSSFNELINALSVESCLCSAGSYGTFGQHCRFCPSPTSLSRPPFICNSSNLLYPTVASGYWVDFSLLSRCDVVSAPCPAVVTCAFGARACPGGGEKICTQNDAECYEGKGCSICCPDYYPESNACFKCPDSTQTTALLAVVAVVCFILAILMSSVSSPSFTQSSMSTQTLTALSSSHKFTVKYFVISSNFLQKMFSVKVRMQMIAHDRYRLFPLTMLRSSSKSTGHSVSCPYLTGSDFFRSASML